MPETNRPSAHQSRDVCDAGTYHGRTAHETGQAALQRREKRMTVRIAAAILAAVVIAAPAKAYIQGIDVYTGDGTINWSSVKSGGISFAFTKATEGVDFIDAKFTANMTNAKAAGVLIGPYHFARPDSS